MFHVKKVPIIATTTITAAIITYFMFIIDDQEP